MRPPAPQLLFTNTHTHTHTHTHSARPPLSPLPLISPLPGDREVGPLCLPTATLQILLPLLPYAPPPVRMRTHAHLELPRGPSGQEGEAHPSGGNGSLHTMRMMMMTSRCTMFAVRQAYVQFIRRVPSVDMADVAAALLVACASLHIPTQTDLLLDICTLFHVDYARVRKREGGGREGGRAPAQSPHCWIACQRHGGAAHPPTTHTHTYTHTHTHTHTLTHSQHARLAARRPGAQARCTPRIWSKAHARTFCGC